MRRTIILGVCSIMVLGWLARPATAEIDESQELWNEYCMSCHGAEGKGDGPAADALKMKPADLTDCQTLKAKSDDHFRKVISEGGSAAGLSSEMAAWSHKLEPDEVDMLVGFIRGFCN